MARKRINKNLVAFLTVMGILLTAVVALIGISLGASRDPEIWANQARARLEHQEYEEAAGLFKRAYVKSKDVKYLVEAAGCYYCLGDAASALQVLKTAQSASDVGTPGHKQAVKAYLDYAWELLRPDVFWQLSPAWRAPVLEAAQDLQRSDAEDVLGPISEAAARLAMSADDPQQRVEGDAALQRAISMNENHPWVVLTRIRREQQETGERVAKLVQERGARQEREALEKQYAQRVTALLKAGVEANPTDWNLLAEYVRLEEQDTAGDGRQVLQRALAQNPESAELHAGLAQFLLAQARRGQASLAREEYDQLLDGAVEHATAAAALSPGMFDAYDYQAQAVLLRGKGGPAAEIAPEQYEAALNIYKEALETTAGVRSIDAFQRARRGGQMLLHIQAFRTAAEYCERAPSSAEREQRLEHLKYFQQVVEGRYPEAAFTWYIRGLAFQLQNQLGNAIQAFEKANQAGQADSRAMWSWLPKLGGALPVYRLALLYRTTNEPGMSLKLTDDALRQYRAFDREHLPPVGLCVNRAELLNELNRSQEALDYVKEVRHEYAALLDTSDTERQRLSAAEAVALSKTKRGGEAASALEDADSAAGLLTQAELAKLSQDRETEVARLQEVLAAEDVEPRHVVLALDRLVNLLGDQERKAARERVASLRQRFASDAPLLRLLDQYDAVLGSSTQEEVDGKLLQLIAAEPDASRRTRRYFDFYAGRAQYAQAQKYLNELEAATPEDLEVQRNQFVLALRTQEFKRAEDYAARLARANDGAGADNAGGAIFRAQLATERKQVEEAVREYREAKARLPRSSTLQVHLGRALLAAKRVDEALEALREAYDLNPNSFEVNALLDNIYKLAPDRRPADWEKHLEQAARLLPRHQYVVDNADRVDPQEGIKLREKRRTAEPQNVENLIRLAQLYANKKVGDPTRAGERLLEAARLEPENLEVAAAAAEFFGSQGKRTEGEQLLAACIEKQSGVKRVQVQMLLAEFYSVLGDTTAAEQAFGAARQMAMEQPPSGPVNETLLGVELKLVEFYRGLPGRARDTITAARWVLDKLNPKEAQDTARAQVVRRAMILAQMELKQLGEAEKEIAAYVKDFGDDPVIALLQAQLKLAQRKWQEAHAALTRVLQFTPDQSSALLQRGELARHLGMSREAAADAMKAHSVTKAAFERLAPEKRPGSGEARQYAAACAGLATIYEMEPQYELAESTLKEMLELSSGSGAEYGATQRQAVTRLMRLYERWNRLDKAQELVSHYMARNPKDPSWTVQMAQVRMRQGEKYTEQADAAAKLDNRADEKKYRADAESEYLAAARYYENAGQLAVEQKLPGHLLFLAYQLDALAAARRTDKALELFRNAEGRAEADMPAVVYAAVIRVYESSGQRAQALLALEKAIVTAYREGGGTVPAVMDFASEYLPAEEVAGVIRALIEKVPAESKESFLLHNLLATQLLKMNQWAEVLEAVKPVLDKAPSNSAERLAAMMGRQQALLASGQTDEAVALLEEVLRMNPDNAIVLNNLAYLLADHANRPAEALPYAERARELEGSAPTVLDTVGWVYVRNGRNEQAEAALKEALALAPNSAAANYHLGVLYQAMGRAPAARTALQRALECATKDKNETIRQQAQTALESLQ